MLFALRGGVLTLLALNLIYTVLVVVSYLKANRLSKREYGLQPEHVVVVSFGVFGLQATLAWALMEQIAYFMPTSTVRLVLYGLFSLIILVALLIVYRLQRIRIKAHKEHS